MCVFHLALCIRLINKRCESSVIQFNARCAGYLLIFGCCKSLCATLVGPLRVIHGILHRDVTVFRKGANPLALFVVFGWFILRLSKVDIGTVASGIALLLLPLRGFYVCLGALACKKYSRAEYVSTVATSCMDSFITCAIFWSLVRGRDMDLLDKNNKLNRKALQSNKPQHGFV